MASDSRLRSVQLAIAAMLVGAVALAMPRSGDGAFPGRNGRLAFASERGGLALGIFTSDSTSTDVTRITGTPPGGADPDWSPDGRKIVFEHASLAHGWGLWLVGADGKRPVPFLTADRDESGFDPAWSPVGDRIAFVVGSERTSGDIWIVRSNGRARRRLTSGSADDSAPSWSPNGKRIAFGRAVGGGGSAIYVVAASGGVARRIGPGQAPAWSPDERTLAFTRTNCRGCSPRLHTMLADGSRVTRLTRPSELSEVNEDAEPDWSPDGRSIAYSVCCDRDRGRSGLRRRPEWRQAASTLLELIQASATLRGRRTAGGSSSMSRTPIISTS